MDDFYGKIQALIKKMTLEEKAGMCSGLDVWRLKGVERLGIPSIMVTDGPHGLRKQESAGDHPGFEENVKAAVCFPTASALAASFDRELVYCIGQTLGNECQAEDVAVLLGPGANIKRSPLCGRNFEYFSEDPYLSGEIAAAHIRGVQSQHIGASLKHFAANNHETRRMTSNSVIDERALHEIYLASFEGAVKGGRPKTVMCSYNKINGVYSAENREILTDILREKWGFDGFVVSDWGAAKDRVKGILAGLELEMPGTGGYTDAQIVAAVQKGTLSEAALDKAVEQILRVVFEYTENRRKDAVFDRAKDHEIAVQAATECAVLLKNDNDVLPLKKNAKIAVIGEFAKNPRYQGGGSSFINAAIVSSAMDALAGNPNITYAQGYDASGATDAALLEEAIRIAGDAEAALVFAGLPVSSESECFDRGHIDMPENQNALIREICAVQSNTVVVLHNGAPVAMPWIDKVPAVLEMYLGGEGVGTAAVSLLFGDVNPSGKLAETFPYKISDNPSYLSFPGFRDEVVYREGVYVGYRYYDKKEMPVLFPFGHGLSYTRFAYSNISVDKTSMKDTETCTVSVKIKNTGNRTGKEIVQLYVRDAQSAIDRPVRELKGFAKVALEPGEEKPVSFILDKRAFAYYDIAAHDWVVESGEFIVELGSSSRNIYLQASITVEGTTEVPMVFTRYSTFRDAAASAKGKAVLGSIIERMGQRRSNVNLGEDSERIAANATNDMPLSSIARFADMSDEQLDGIVAALNG